MSFKHVITTAAFALCIITAASADTHGHHAPATDAKQNIVEIAAGNDDFTTLVAAVTAAGLADTLQGAGPFTLFAPTDAAFAALPAGTLDKLLAPENRDQLIAVLTYHVVSGNVKAADVIGLTEAETVQGGKIAVTANAKGVMVDDANVVTTDIVASNGVIHVIDKVILPKS